MRYMGGKSRIAKELTQVMLGLSDKREVYVEPFLGGGAMAEQMCQHFEHKYLSDAHVDLMLMWDAVLNQGWEPPTEVSVNDYQRLKESEPSALRGFVGFGGSFGGKWFGGYARGETPAGAPRNYLAESWRNLSRNVAGMAGAKVFAARYQTLPSVPEAPLIYCDPPYASTTGYETGEFDHTAFWAKAQQWAETGSDVFVSEYTAPEGWVPVWQKQVLGQLDPRKAREKPVEKLFVWEASEMYQKSTIAGAKVA